MMILMMKIIILVVLLSNCDSYKLSNRVFRNKFSNSIEGKIENDSNNMIRKSLTSMIISFSLLSLPLMSLSSPSYAATDIKGGLIYKTGKSPRQEDPNDPKKGTKKETAFLRCLSNCKADCQKPGGI